MSDALVPVLPPPETADGSLHWLQRDTEPPEPAIWRLPHGFWSRIGLPGNPRDLALMGYRYRGPCPAPACSPVRLDPFVPPADMLKAPYHFIIQGGGALVPAAFIASHRAWTMAGRWEPENPFFMESYRYAGPLYLPEEDSPVLPGVTG